MITGNKEYGLAKSLAKVFPQADFVGRPTGYDLSIDIDKIAEQSLGYDLFINCAYVDSFNQVTLLDKVYNLCNKHNHKLHIISVGSTVDRFPNHSNYAINKKSLREHSINLSLNSVWRGGPKVSLISLGTLSNTQEKKPNRKCIDIDQAALYIKWISDQPSNLSINEISVDPIQ